MRIFTLADANPIQTVEAARMEHRRIVSPMNGGPQSIDLGLNKYGAGGEFAGPYAYNREEFCYISPGETEIDSSGVRLRSTPGTFMWRPAGTTSNWLRGIRDVVNVCVFSPARVDAASHRLSPADVRTWDGQPESRRIPHRVHISLVPLTPFPGASDQTGLVHRQVFSKDNSCDVMDVDHTMIQIGSTFAVEAGEAEELWWLESGRLQLTALGERSQLNEHEGLVRQPGEAIEQVRATVDSVLIRFSLTGLR